MKSISLSKGLVALVDNEDFEHLSQFKWYSCPCRPNGAYYANRTVYSGGKKTTVSMHRELMGLGKGDNRTCDHINHDTLDNRRSNLRIAQDWQNKFNRGKTVRNTSGYKGVSWEKCCKKWRAQIAIPGSKRKTIHLGLFVNPKNASIAYQKAQKQIAGDFACQ